MENIRAVVCRNFNRLVESSGKTKREIAQQMSVSEATLQRWKSGDSFPELPNIEKLALVLGVSTMEFYRSEDVAVRKEPVSLFAKKLLNIPDEFFDEAQKLSLDDRESWEMVMAALKTEIKLKQKREEAARGKASGESR